MGKKLTSVREKIDTTQQYVLEDAVKMVKGSAVAKFDETIELSVVLGVDPKQNDQQVRGMVQLPHGTGKKLKVLVFAKGEKEKEDRKRIINYLKNFS